MKQLSIIPNGIILTLLLCANISGSAQEVSVKTSFDTTSILTGDQINFTVTLDKQSDLNLTLQSFKDTLVSGIEILKGPFTDTLQLSDNRISIRDRYLVTSFDSGKYEIPPIYAEMMTDEGIKRFYSDYNYLHVKRPDIAPADTTAKYYDIIGPYKVPLSAGEILPWLLVFLIVATGSWFLYKYLKNKKNKVTEPVSQEPAEAAYIIAYRSLEKLKNEKLWQKGHFKDYFSRISDILRTYLDNRFSMISMESTTGEILADLKRTDYVDPLPLERLKNVLELSDMVKFAKHMPDPSDCELAMDDSWSFVSLTRKEQSKSEIPSDETDPAGDAHTQTITKNEEGAI